MVYMHVAYLARKEAVRDRRETVAKDLLTTISSIPLICLLLCVLPLYVLILFPGWSLLLILEITVFIIRLDLLYLFTGCPS